MDSENLLSKYNFKNKDKLRLFILLPIIIILVALIICFIVLYVKEKNKTESYSKSENKNINLEVQSSNYKSYIPLSSWKSCDAKTKLSDFIMNITSADNYVPKEDRIAVFDFDGTIFQENDPIYNDYKLYYYRVYNDSNYSATEEQKKIGDEIKKSMEIGEVPDDVIELLTLILNYGKI